MERHDFERTERYVKNTKKIYFVVLILIGLLTNCNNVEKEKNNIRKTFDKYKTSIIYDEYDEAASCLDSRTLMYYDTLLEHIRYSDSVKVSSLPLMSQLTILLIRNLATTKELASFNGKDLFAFSIKNRLIEKNDVMNAHIDKVQIDGQFAKGRLITESLMNEKEDSPKLSSAVWLNFYKEQGDWKMNLTAVMDLANTLFAHEISEKHISQSQFLLGVIELHTGLRPNSEIWEPALKTSR